MRPSTMRWAQRGITYWLQEDLSVMIMKWRNQGHQFNFQTNTEAKTA